MKEIEKRHGKKGKGRDVVDRRKGTGKREQGQMEKRQR